MIIKVIAFRKNTSRTIDEFDSLVSLRRAYPRSLDSDTLHTHSRPAIRPDETLVFMYQHSPSSSWKEVDDPRPFEEYLEDRDR